jgi:hypothetical protein
MQTPALFQRARQLEAEKFKKHDINQFIAPEVKDIVERVVAAGMKVMYSEDMRDDVQRALESDAPPGQKMAENVVGLILMLDQKSKGIPQAAIFPVAMKLLDEAADVLNSAGQPVTQEDYSDAARRMFVLLGQKLGVPDEELMATAEQYSGRADDEQAEQMPSDEMPMPEDEGVMT